MVNAGDVFLAGIFRRRRSVLFPPPWIFRPFSYSLLLQDGAKWRRFSTASSEWASPPEFEGESAYEILGVSDACSSDEVKASFRKLAKQTHPDLASSEDSEASKRFVQIVAAYEILSDPRKRAVYDQHLLAQRNQESNYRQQRSGSSSSYHMYATYANTAKEMEVVEWLRWYRQAVKDILSEKKAIGGTGYFDVLQRDFYSAIHAAYYGPEVEPIDLLPDRFEAEVRSNADTPEVLHLVSGRDLFGVVRIADKVPELSDTHYRKLVSKESLNLDSCSSIDESRMRRGSCQKEDVHMGLEDVKPNISDVYRDLELHVFGRLAATASRVPPVSCSSSIENEDSEDRIYVYSSYLEESVRSKALLGTISGLGNDAEESTCVVYNSDGTKTHVILKHRTLLVKHLHWFQLGDEVSICECRCTRARLPPSKQFCIAFLWSLGSILSTCLRFWLFEPRCSMHDIGGWYIETFGLDKKKRNVPTQRCWNGIDSALHFERKLHPAVYLLGLAYRTLDIEVAMERKQAMSNVVGRNLVRMLGWCKKLV